MALGISKHRPKREKHLININDINEEMKLIDGSDTDYITPSGHVYKWYYGEMYYPKKAYQNNHNKYVYVSITFSDGKNKQRRQHILVAKAFLPNPDPEHLKIVGHKDDIKWHNTLDNLYWTDNQENTQSAVNHGLNEQPIAEQNENSYLVKVLDKNTKQIVGVYGSIKECNRCIENITLSTISKMVKKDNYNPRSRKYIYQIATKQEFEQYLHLRSKRLIENSFVDKSPKIFYLINKKLGYKEKFDNQTQASKICNIPQATISNMIKNGGIVNGWECRYIDATTYKNSSGYKNFIDIQNQYVLQNIKTKEIKIFATQKEVKDFVNFNGHDISGYLQKDHILMNEWKIISIEEKNLNYEQEDIS